MAAVHHFTSGQGETFSTVVTWDIDGELVDLTGYSARMQLRKEYSSAEAAISLDEARRAGARRSGRNHRHRDRSGDQLSGPSDQVRLRPRAGVSGRSRQTPPRGDLHPHA